MEIITQFQRFIYDKNRFGHSKNRNILVENLSILYFKLNTDLFNGAREIGKIQKICWFVGV